MRLEWTLAWRFRRNKSANGFLSFISASSTFGIGLGCFVLILILSVMNGFENQLKQRILSVVPHGELKAVSPNGIDEWQGVIGDFSTDPRILSANPVIKLTGMLQKGKLSKAAEITAIDPQTYASSLLQNITPEQWLAFQQTENAVILGAGVVKHLGLSMGQQVQLMLPRLSEDGSLKAPKTVWLTLVGQVKIGGELDKHIGYMHLSQAAQLADISSGAQSIEFRYQQPFSASAITRGIGFSFPQHVYISDWTRTQGHLYQDIQLVRLVVYIALVLLIAVACFNIVSTLVMSVNEKQGEVAMLKTMGAENGVIIRVFMLQGMINGLIGTVFGVLLGVVVAINLSAIALQIEQVLGVQFLSGDIYFIDFLPSDLQWPEVFITAAIALSLSMLSTIYPAIKATKVSPAEVLGH